VRVVGLIVVPGQALGPVLLGAREGDLLDALGPPNTRRPKGQGRGLTLYWDRPALRVDLDDQGNVEFCEATYADGEPQAMLGDTDLFGSPASEVAEVLKASQHGYFEEDGYAFTCPTGLALWRAVLPHGDADADTDDRDGDYWRTVAVAAPGYW
jgi:hypothetical protein